MRYSAGLKPANDFGLFRKPKLSQDEKHRLVSFAIAVLFIVFSLLALTYYRAISPRDQSGRIYVLSPPARSQNWQ
jgi:hypothetical protein